MEIYRDTFKGLSKTVDDDQLIEKANLRPSTSLFLQTAAQIATLISLFWCLRLQMKTHQNVIVLPICQDTTSSNEDRIMLLHKQNND